MGNTLKYYTYAHYNLNGDIFYVGKGHGSRAYSHHDRHKLWKDYVYNTNGITIKILQYWNTEDEAFEHEKALIEHYKSLGFKLVNLTNGGKGFNGYIQSKEVRLKKREKLLGYKHKEIVCPHCNTKGGQTTMKRWHFDKCTGIKPFKARVTINNKRIFLGYFKTKEEVKSICIDAYKKANKTLPKEFIKNYGI
jgi:hypothetical protein